MLKRKDGINLSIKAKDSRYPIPVFLDDADEPSFILRFNPGDPFILNYADALRSLNVPETSGTGEMLSFTDKIEKNLDAIFSDGAARLICRYDDVEHSLLNSLLEKVREGYEDFHEKARKAENAAKAKAAIEAKKSAAPFIAPVK